MAATTSRYGVYTHDVTAWQQKPNGLWKFHPNAACYLVTVVFNALLWCRGLLVHILSPEHLDFPNNSAISQLYFL